MSKGGFLELLPLLAFTFMWNASFLGQNFDIPMELGAIENDGWGLIVNRKCLFPDSLLVVRCSCSGRKIPSDGFISFFSGIQMDALRQCSFTREDFSHSLPVFPS